MVLFGNFFFLRVYIVFSSLCWTTLKTQREPHTHAVACHLGLINSLIWVKNSMLWGDTRGWCWVLKAFRAEWTHHSWFANQNHKSTTHRSRMRKQAFNPVARAPLDRKKKKKKSKPPFQKWKTYNHWSLAVERMLFRGRFAVVMIPQSIDKIKRACSSSLTSTGALVLQKQEPWFTETLGAILFIDVTDLRASSVV